MQPQLAVQVDHYLGLESPVPRGSEPARDSGANELDADELAILEAQHGRKTRRPSVISPGLDDNGTGHVGGAVGAAGLLRNFLDRALCRLATARRDFVHR